MKRGLPSVHVRAVGAGGLLIAIAGLLLTTVTLIWLLIWGGLGRVVQFSNTDFAMALLIANLLDLVAYTALVITALRLVRMNSSGRTAGLLLGLYLMFMAIAQPLGAHIWMQRPLDPRIATSPAGLELLVRYAGAGPLLVYGLALFWVMHAWGGDGLALRPTRPPLGAPRAAPTGKGVRASTNAPRDWPLVHVADWMPQMPFYGQLAVVSALAEGFKGRSGVHLSLMRSRLYDDGVVRIPMMIEEEGRQTAVFVYSEAGPESAAHYSAARAFLRQREGVNAVYYAPAPLTPRPPGQILEALDTPHFSKPEKDRPPAEYALWWPTPEEPLLRDSPVLAHLDAWFEALDGYTYLLFSSFVKTLDLSNEEEEEMQVFGLPVQPLMVPVDGPADLSLYLHASRDEGLWLAFDVGRTSRPLRNRLLGQLATLARNVRQAIESSGKLPSRREDEARALYFWRRARQDALELEAANRPGIWIGSILEVGTARLRVAGASGTEDRQAVAADSSPGEALTEFVREQLGRAFGLLKSGTGQAEAGGGPNLHPFVAVRKGNDVHHVTLSYFEEPEAASFCPLIALEHSGFDAIALVCDGIARIDEERFDAIVVHAEQAGRGRRHVFLQRYRPTPGGVEALGNWLLRGQEESLLPDPMLPSAPDPSPSLEAYVSKIVDTTLAWIRTGDESGAELYHGAEPLFSPALHLRDGNEDHMRRFMMGNLSWAQAACLEALAEMPRAQLAVFVYDWVAERNGRPTRSLRFHAHERGAPASWLYALHYEVPVPGRRFEASAPLTFVRAGRPLFPT